MGVRKFWWVNKCQKIPNKIETKDKTVSPKIRLLNVFEKRKVLMRMKTNPLEKKLTGWCQEPSGKVAIHYVGY